jgi:hypothetical protein
VRAFVAGTKKVLDEVMTKVRETDAGSARAIRELADNYRYDALTQSFEEACCQ